MNFKNKPIIETGLHDKDSFTFFVKVGDETLLARLPTKNDYKRVKKAKSLCSTNNFNRFLTVMEKKHVNWPKYICKNPATEDKIKGKIYFLMIYKKEIIGFISMLFSLGQTFFNHSVPEPNAITAFASFCVLDQYQRKGVGTAYAHLTEFIARYVGAKYMVGSTYPRRGMLNIRMKMGWKVVKIHENEGKILVCVRKKLNIGSNNSTKIL